MGKQWFPILADYPFATTSESFVNANTGSIISVKAHREYSDSRFYGKVVIAVGDKSYVIWADSEGHRGRSLSNEKEIEAAMKASLINATEKMHEIVAGLNGEILLKS